MDLAVAGAGKVFDGLPSTNILSPPSPEASILCLEVQGAEHPSGLSTNLTTVLQILLIYVLSVPSSVIPTACIQSVDRVSSSFAGDSQFF